MFITGFVTRIKCAFRDKEMIFWTLLFPVMLATLFYFCFSNLDSADAFSPVKTAVVADQAYRQAAGFQAALEEVSKEGEDFRDRRPYSGEKSSGSSARAAHRFDGTAGVYPGNFPV